VLQLSALEQLVYATIEADPARPKPVKLRTKCLAWLTVLGITLYPMCVPRSRLPAVVCPPPPAAASSLCPGIVRCARVRVV
jgi:hypothetical protein